MNPAKIKRAREIFEIAVDRPPEEREAVVSQHCAGDPDLRVFVERLLGYETAVLDGFMSSPAFTPALDETAATEKGVPKRVGRYDIVGPLGEGGMGTVYLAEQTEPVRRQVALKIIKLGMDTRQVVARFESERQALATLSHPNVAKVFDGGATEDGRPFFVMEHVPGVAINDFCDFHRLSVSERLELFMQVCHAIQHAHQNGIIHRDIKPSNLLVSNDDGKPVAKVIDFGVAKAVSRRLTEKTLFTTEGQVIGTPAYMSPEQAGWGGLEIDTRTDIYSLGALLYELLTGSPPFDPVRMRESPFDELCRTIREVDPPRPSTRFGELGSSAAVRMPDSSSATAADIAHHRRTQPASLTKQLRGDLDWITMKSLEKDRSRRYESASGLAADVQRYLDHEPVLAGPPSAAYRARKFVCRHRAFVAGTTAVAVVLVAGIVLTTTFAIGQARARAAEAEQRRVAETERARAETELAKSKQIVAFTQEMLAGIDPETAGDLDKSLMRMILDNAAERIETELTGQPEVEAQIRFTIGNAYRAIGEYQAAQPHLETALEIRRQMLGEDHPDTLTSVDAVAFLYYTQGRYEEAESLYVPTLERRRRVLGEEHPTTLLSVSNLGELYQDQGRYDEAAPLLESVLAGRRRVLGEEHEDTLVSMGNLARLYERQGRYDEAEALHLRTLELAALVLDAEHPNTLATMNNLAAQYLNQGRYEDAEQLFARTVEIKRRVIGEEHPDTLLSQNSLALVYQRQARYGEAEPLYVKTLAAQRRVLGEDHPSTMLTANNLALLYYEQARYADAEPLYARNFELACRVLGEDHPDTLTYMQNLAAVYGRQGRYDQAEPLYIRTLESKRRVLGDEHPLTLITMNNLANMYKTQGRLEEAEPLFTRTVALMQRVLGSEHPNTLSVTYNLATVYERQERHEEAERLYLRALEAQRRALGAEHPSTLRTCSSAVKFYMKLHRFEHAELPAIECYEAHLSKYGPEHTQTQNAINLLIDLYEAWGKPEQVAEWQAKLRPPQPAETPSNP